MTPAAMPTRKRKFTDELKKKYPCFRLGRDASEAECITCRAGTYVSVANKGVSDLEAHVNSAKHKTAASGESSSSEVADYFVIKTDTATMDAARGLKCEVTEYFVSETETTTMAAARGESSSSEVAEYFVSKTDTTTAA